MRKGARRKYWFFIGILGNRGPTSDGVPKKTLVLGTHHIPDTPFRAWRARWRMTGSTSGAGSFACTVKGGGGSGGRRGAKSFLSIDFGGFVKVSLFWHLLTRKFHVKIQQGPSRIRQVRQVLTRRFLDEPIFNWCLTRNFLIQPLTRTFLVKENAHTLTRNCPCYAFNKGIPLLTKLLIY